MNRAFVITCIHEFNDRGSVNSNVKEHSFPIEELVPGAVFPGICDSQLEVVSIDKDEFTFKFIGNTYTINRHWQLLSTNPFALPNEYVDESLRFVFRFTNEYKSAKWNSQKMIDIFNEMVANADEGNLWKNIPLARELMVIIKDESPLRNKDINPALRMYICERVIGDKYIDIRDVPRLFMSYCEFWYASQRVLLHEDVETCEYDVKFFKEVDSNLYKLRWLLTRPHSDVAKDIWSKMGMLKSDPVQITPEWEKNIYEVEAECERRLKGETRGMGFCFAYWSAKQAALAERGIEWRTPNLMNPGVLFD